jgi:SAM-dependent methyltransferase
VLTQLPARLFYGADLIAGWATGCPCPSCGARRNPVRRRKHGLDAVRDCLSCGLLYRATAISDGALAKLYYSHFYAGQGIATEPSVAASADAVARAVEREGKDRSPLVARAIEATGREPRAICVFGCSWGYELLALQRLGLPVFGIELSDPRRRVAVERFGLEVYPSIESARDRHRDVLVLSSHVLEHISALARVLDQLRDALQPRVLVHVTPKVIDAREIVASAIGREHVLGVTGEFWRRYARSRELELALFSNGECAGSTADELVAWLSPHG